MTADIRVRRVTEAPRRGDGRRFLVDRLWPRGARKAALRIDGWLKDVAPSHELRKWFGHEPARWDEFRRRYFAELDANAGALGSLREAAWRGPVTLCFAARDMEHNNAVALREYLCREGVGGTGTDRATLCVHAGGRSDEATGGSCTPIYTSTAYAFPNPANENIYPRYFNVPNQRAVAEKIAALEGGEAALVFGSGMAAISTLLLGFLKPGDHAIFQADLYGGTHHLVTGQLPRLGISVSLGRTVADFAAAVRAETRLIYIESPSNPLLRCMEIAGVARLGREVGAMTVIDNTFATPINQNPIAMGMDVVVHSATKYLNGHSDLNAGAVVASAEVVRRLREAAIDFGGMLDSHACHQLERGMKTLALRVRQHNESAGRLAAFLRGHPSVARVHYPGLQDHPDHEIAAGQMRGFGGMLSFELRDPRRVDGMLGRFRVATPALSLGGVETLVCVPARTSHRTMSPEQRREAGITDGLVRVSVGIEGAGDLEDDFAGALGKG